MKKILLISALMTVSFGAHADERADIIAHFEYCSVVSKAAYSLMAAKNAGLSELAVTNMVKKMGKNKEEQEARYKLIQAVYHAEGPALSPIEHRNAVEAACINNYLERE